MIIRTTKNFEIKEIKNLFDSTKEMDSIEETFPEEYYRRIIRKGILLVAEERGEIIGVCFGTYNIKEKWADFLGIVVKKSFRKKGIGTALALEFEKVAKSKKLKTIDLYADKGAIKLFDKLNYQKGRTYVAFRKKLK